MSQQPQPQPPPKPGCKESPIQAQIPSVYPSINQQQEPESQFYMVSPPQVQLPLYFNCKKYTIVTLASVRIAIVVIVIILNCFVIGFQSAPFIYGSLSKGVLISIMVVMCLLAVLFLLIGLIGALKENYCLCVTFAVLELLNIIVTIIPTIKMSTGVVALPVISIISIAVTSLFIRDLSDIRQQQQRLPQMVYA